MLAPAGNSITLVDSTESAADFSGYHSTFTHSGTSALAAAISIAKQHKPVAQPEVIIPAYACPDLISAAAFNNIKCRLCDLEQNQTGYSIQSLRDAINDNTIAIITVNFLGIQEQNKLVKELADQHDLLLIEDNAQWFPELNGNESLVGQLSIISFGRGKPVSLLGGGCLLVEENLSNRHGQYIQQMQANLNSHPQTVTNFYLKALAYNTLINPLLYSLLKYVPGLKLGETKYKPLLEIERLDEVRQQLLKRNINQHIKREPTAQLYLQNKLDENNKALTNLPVKFLARTKRLLRYPILAEDHFLRDQLHDKLNESGLGATKLYATTMDEIDGTSDFILTEQDYPNASDFASRLLTLPVHEKVSMNHLRSMSRIINE